MSIAEKLQTIAENEQRVYDAGYAKGQAEGGDTTAAYDEGFEAGKKAEYDAFWDALQHNGDGTVDYRYKFWYWTDDAYNPKYPIYSTKASMTNCFGNARIKNTRVAVDCTGTTNIDGLFSWASFLTTIPLLKVAEHNTFSTSIFYGAGSLEDVTIEGYFGVSVNIQHSTKLSKASITSIINALSPTTSGLTVTLSTVAVNKAFETSEGANDGVESAEWKTLKETKSNWNIGYA